MLVVPTCDGLLRNRDPPYTGLHRSGGEYNHGLGANARTPADTMSIGAGDDGSPTTRRAPKEATA